MRSLGLERKPRGPVRATRTAPARAKRELPGVQPGTARKPPKDGVLSRISGRFSLFVRRPMFALCAVLTVLVLIGALLASGVIGRTVRGINRAIDGTVADAGFGIAEIHINGNRRTPYNQVLEVLGMQPGQSIFSADLYGAQRRLSHLDWIASAEVHRRYPDAVFVTLIEKRPFALWQMPADAKGSAPIAVVERSGAVITTRDVDKFRRLPKLIGAGAAANAADLVDAVQSHRAIAARIAAYIYQSGRRWNLLLDNGVTVQLPETGWPKQLDALEHLIIDSGILERDISEIDLRSPSHYFFVLKSGEKKDVERGKET
jgi:cell division protein FtsQ